MADETGGSTQIWQPGGEDVCLLISGPAEQIEAGAGIESIEDLLSPDALAGSLALRQCINAGRGQRDRDLVDAKKDREDWARGGG